MAKPGFIFPRLKNGMCFYFKEKGGVMDKMLGRTLALVILFVGCLVSGGVEAATLPLEVGPSGYPYTSIQAAIAAASSGDTVLVHDGTYKENINFSGKAITVKSVNGAAKTIIDANSSGRGVTFNSGEGSGSVLDGFTITNGFVPEDNGGGIYCTNSSSPTITNCSISGNTGWYNGGGISCYSGSPTITNCTINGNTTYGWGGGISCGYSSVPTITNCTISGNTANAGKGGGISCDTSCFPTITNCIISGNTANNGGGIACYFSSLPTIINCTISGNIASSTIGGGIYCDSTSTAAVQNTILWGNVPNEIYLLGGGPPIMPIYSDVDQGGYAGLNGNIRQNPLFVDPTNGNFRFQPNSPCIDAAYSNGAPITDMKGNPRFDTPWVPNTGGGSHPYFDMGALEYGKPPVADFDGDVKTDIAVYRASTGAWYVHPSKGGTPYGIGWGGDPNDKPVPGDYDGDIKTDYAVYRTSTGAWYVKPSSGATAYGVGWGGDPNDEPVPGDYDGDGKTDIAVYRSSTGAWYVYPSGGTAPYGEGWGGDPNDKPVPGDYDGDGRTDVAVYRTSTGAWYIKPSSGSSPYGIGWGGDPNDKPVPGDYDGDGKTDTAAVLWDRYGRLVHLAI